MEITLSQKERFLLEDQKSHEQICIEKYNKYANQAQDIQLKQIFKANGQQEQSRIRVNLNPARAAGRIRTCAPMC